MRRTLVALILAACAVAAPAFGQPSPPALKATLAACQTGPSEDQRFALFTASMPAYRGTRRMAMRFDLFMRPHGSDMWEPVRSKGFGTWIRSQPGKEGLVWTKRVERLESAADYRVAVRFRWYQAGTAPRADRVRRSATCVQPDQRPDLAIDAIAVQPGPDASSRTYVLSVVNAGTGSAGAFSVGLSTATTVLGQRDIAALPAGEHATVEIVGPACTAGEQLVGRADIGRVVDESDERDNRFARTC